MKRILVATTAWTVSLIVAAGMLVSTVAVRPADFCRSHPQNPHCVSPSPTIAPTPTPTLTPTPIPTPTATPGLPGWNLVFADEFATWDPSRYFVYPNTWTNHYTGHYDPSIISSDGSKLRLYIHTDQYPRIAAFCPIPPGSLSGRGDSLGMRVEFRLRADRMLGYKGVPLLWPMSGNWPTDGEIDGPESEFDRTPSAFMHYQGATSGSQQDYYPYPAGTSWQDWHTYATEWKPGVSAEFFIDGVSIGKSTSRVPNTAMHLVMQFETRLNLIPPDPSVNGYVEIEYLKVWFPA